MIIPVVQSPIWPQRFTELRLKRGTVRFTEMGREIRRRVGAAMALPLADVVFVRRGQIVKTTSGKVRRKELRRRYLANELQRLN